jgi:hypothetical protein
MNRRFTILFAVLALFVASAPQVHAKDTEEPAAILIDTVVVRPVGVAVTVACAAVFVVALPFAAIAGEIDRTAETLVARPARAIFCRPLGNFEKMRNHARNHIPAEEQ